MSKNKVKIFNFFRQVFKISFLERTMVKIIRSNSIYGRFASKLIPNNYQYKKGSYRKLSINNIHFNLDISDYIGHFLYFGFQDPAFKELLTLSQDKKIIFDIGANIGSTALLMANSNNSKLFAFEPDPFNYDCLLQNLNLNPTINITHHQIGLGDTESKLKLVVTDKNNRGENKIDMNATADFSWVNITTLDLFCKKNDISKIDLIKIDVEGFEYNVLKGAIEIIKTSKPTLFIEVIDENLRLQDSSAKELVSFLEKHYSVIYNATTKKKVTSEDNFEKLQLDIVAIA